MSLSTVHSSVQTFAVDNPVIPTAQPAFVFPSPSYCHEYSTTLLDASMIAAPIAIKGMARERNTTYSVRGVIMGCHAFRTRTQEQRQRDRGAQ